MMQLIYWGERARGTTTNGLTVTDNSGALVDVII
jgi:hypothetical protein